MSSKPRRMLAKLKFQKVMVANAGIILTKRLMDITPDEWDRVQAVGKDFPFFFKHG